MYDNAIKSADDDEFAHLNQVSEEVDVTSGMNEDEEGSGEDEENEEGDDGGEDEAMAPETPFGHSKVSRRTSLCYNDANLVHRNTSRPLKRLK
jgi:hypothetical protein